MGSNVIMLHKVWRKIKKWYWKPLYEQELKSYYDMRDLFQSKYCRDPWEVKIAQIKRKIRDLG